MKVLAPDLGEYSAYGSPIIAEVYVSEGNNVTEGSLLCLIMIAKVSVEVKAPNTGKVTKVYIKKGDTVKSGDPLFEIE